MQTTLDHRKLYRLPWNLADNAISWLEPTAACNLSCFGCYRTNIKQHKSLDEVADDLDVFMRLRNSDGISVAGGDPLTHPEVVKIIEMIAKRGLKPILNTNGLALDRDLLVELKRAGLMGLTFHIDSKQTRPGWKGKTEAELNELRLHFARMAADVGNLSCAFNSTVYPDTLDECKDILAWGRKHIDIVNVIVFIIFRAGMVEQGYDYYVGDKKIDLEPLPYSTTDEVNVGVMAPDIVNKLREVDPAFQPCAYLNGTEQPDSFKWLLTGYLGSKEKVYGYVGPKLMELAQTSNHLFKGKYLAYADPKTLRHGRSMLLLSPFDRGIRSIGGAYLKDVARNPLRAFNRLHFQSVMIIQPVDILADGRQDMCDSCPDMTVWNGQLAWSCRLEEPMQYGGFMRTVPSAKTHGEDQVPIAGDGKIAAPVEVETQT
jgi:hypothetical protein